MKVFIINLARSADRKEAIQKRTFLKKIKALTFKTSS